MFNKMSNNSKTGFQQMVFIVSSSLNGDSKSTTIHFTLSVLLSFPNAVIAVSAFFLLFFLTWPARMRSSCLYDSLQRAVGILTMMGLQLLFMHPPRQPFTL